MPMNLMQNIADELNGCDFGIKSIMLYGLGEAVIHPNLSAIIDLFSSTKTERVQINSDAHMIKRIKTNIPGCSSLVITHKDKIIDISENMRYLKSFNRISHVFILSKLTMNKLQEIDIYIDSVVEKHSDQKFAISPRWSCEFGKPAELKSNNVFTIEDGIKIDGVPVDSSEAVRAYYQLDGTIKKCFFSDKIFATIGDVLNTDELCSDCNVRAQSYEIII
ncbi:MAG: hypothetical protein ABII20_06375 [Candidatus Omnitrophota bacterium]